MLPHLFIATIGLGVTVLLISVALRWDLGVVWARRVTDWHHTPREAVPRLGGVALVASFVVVELWIARFCPELRGRTPGHDVILVSSIAMFGLGFWDDLRPVGAFGKLVVQVTIAATVWLCGLRIEVWRIPWSQAPFELGLWGPVLTIFWLVGMANLINLIDGLDGLAGGICLMLMLLTAAVGHQNGHCELLALGMAGALLGFLWFNFPPARIYLGDGGAYFLGFQIGLYAIVNSQKGAVFSALLAPLFLLALPIVDAVAALARRGLRGLPLFRPDRKHLHHRLMSTAASKRGLVLKMHGINLVLLALALACFWSGGQWLARLAAAAVLLLLVCAGSCKFSRRWLAIHRVIGGCLRMRSEVRYGLCLARWLELEALRRAGPDALWPDLVFAAKKLGFDSVKLTLSREYRDWQRRGPAHESQSQLARFEGHYGCIELRAAACPWRGPGGETYCAEQRACQRWRHGCLADPRAFETVSELLAEAWSKAAAQWLRRDVPLRFRPEQPGYEQTIPDLAALPLCGRSDIGSALARHEF